MLLSVRMRIDESCLKDIESGHEPCALRRKGFSKSKVCVVAASKRIKPHLAPIRVQTDNPEFPRSP